MLAQKAAKTNSKEVIRGSSNGKANETYKNLSKFKKSKNNDF